MKNIIIGTAGHIDHGKTTLIKALTNIETDRLEEEKKRGITIDLGFAFFNLPSGKRAGIVDVPGHERFIKNMLAGASGIDLVLFVISAEEGIMPQTQEHLDILNILDVKKGIVVLTKSDLVDDEWLDMMKDDIKTALKGTFLEQSPMIPVDSVSKNGLDKLIQTIDEQAEQVEAKSSSLAVRMPIDRVFTLQGFGTIVTGTLVEGRVEESEQLTIFPSMKEAKVRSIQVHSENVKTAYAGQRVAINVTGIKKSEINRGEILAHNDSMQVTSMLDVELKLLKHSHRELKNWTRLRLYHGTKEILCRLVLLDRDGLKPGESCFAQLRLEEPTACKYGDRFVVRFYSPLETIGGGVILDPNAHKHKRFKDDIIDELMFKAAGDQDAIIDNLIRKHSAEFNSIDAYVKLSGLPKEEVTTQVASLIEKGVLVELSRQVYLHREFILNKEQEILSLLNKYHEKYPFRLGLPKEELRSKTFSQIKNKVFDEVLNLYQDVLKKQGQFIADKHFELLYSEKQNEMIQDIQNSLDAGAFKPTEIKSILGQYSDPHVKDIFSNLVAEQILIRINDSIYLTKETFEKGLSSLKTEFRAKGKLSLGECKDVLETSRKYIVPIMEYLDGQGITKRVGDERMLRGE